MLRGAVQVFIVEKNYGYTHVADAYNEFVNRGDSDRGRVLFMSSGEDPRGRVGIHVGGEDKQRFVNLLYYLLKKQLPRLWNDCLVCETGLRNDVLAEFERQLLAYRRIPYNAPDPVWGAQKFKYSGKGGGKLKDDLISALLFSAYWAVRFWGDPDWVRRADTSLEPMIIRGVQFVKEVFDNLPSIPDFMYEA